MIHYTSASFPEIEPASPSQIGTSSGALSIEHLDEIAKLSPRAAIIEAWDRVIFATRKVDGALPRPWNGPYSLKSTVDKFVEHSVLTKRQAELYDEMNKLYFAVVRYEAKNVDEDSVKMYIRSADVMTAHLYAVYKRAERIRKAGGS